MQKIKIWKCSHSSLITIFSTHAYCILLHWLTTALARWQRSFKTQNSVCKSRRICFPAPINSRKAKGKFFHSRNFPFNFSGVDDCWEIYPSALTDTILCLTMIFATLLVPQRSPCSAVKWLDQLHSHTALLKVCHQVPLLLHYTWCPSTVFPLSHPLWSLPWTHLCKS